MIVRRSPAVHGPMGAATGERIVTFGRVGKPVRVAVLLIFPAVDATRVPGRPGGSICGALRFGRRSLANAATCPESELLDPGLLLEITNAGCRLIPRSHDLGFVGYASLPAQPLQFIQLLRA